MPEYRKPTIRTLADIPADDPRVQAVRRLQREGTATKDGCLVAAQRNIYIEGEQWQSLPRLVWSVTRRAALPGRISMTCGTPGCIAPRHLPLASKAIEAARVERVAKRAKPGAEPNMVEPCPSGDWQLTEYERLVAREALLHYAVVLQERASEAEPLIAPMMNRAADVALDVANKVRT